MPHRYCLGIDLGTTNTVAAVWEHGKLAPFPLQITQPLGGYNSRDFGRSDTLPSAVHLQSADRVFVGRAVKQVARLQEECVVTSIKKFMGRHWVPSFKVESEKVWTPELISACILRAIHDEVVGHYGELPERLVVGVPASFGVESRRSTLRAIELAGFARNTSQLLDEPTAALVHLIRTRKLKHDGSRPQRLMMVDIGGGTLDVSMLEVIDTAECLDADVFGTSRYNELAGDDFDLSIAGLLLHYYEQETKGAYVRCEGRHARRLFLMRLLAAAETAKKELSVLYLQCGGRLAPSKLKTTVRVEDAPHGKAWSHSLSIEDLHQALQEFFYFDDTNRDVNRDSQTFATAIQQCLDSAVGNNKDFEFNQVEQRYPIDHVFLTGGSASLPMLAPAISRIVLRDPVLVDDPFHAVAMGAAWFAGANQYDQRPVKLRQRLYNALYLMDDSNRLEILLKTDQRVPLIEPREFSLRMPSREFRLKLNFFTGRPGPYDTIDDISPLVTRVFEFPESMMLPEGHALTLRISINDNRELQFSLRTIFGGETYERAGQASIGLRGIGPSADSIPAVNLRADDQLTSFHRVVGTGDVTVGIHQEGGT